MKQLLDSLNWRRLSRGFFYLALLSTTFVACRKTENPFREDRSSYSSDVLDKWLTLEIRLYKDATGIPNGGFTRPAAYSGIVALESLGQDDLSGKQKYNGLGSLPKPNDFKRYFWPASVNAGLASFNRSFFSLSNSNATDLAAIDSLENAVRNSYGGESPDVMNRSAAFGRSIASAIFSWSETDGYSENSVKPYVIPVGPGLWQPTAPAFALPTGAYWRNDRPIIEGSGNNTQPGAPISYSEDPKSPFYQMVNELYVASKVLTPDQKAWALFWRDLPGVSTPGHWLSIVRQVIKQTGSHLDKACLAYALVGICLNDGLISVFDTKFTYNLLRPITYIRNVIGDASWLSLLTTPNFPEYTSAHSVVSAASSEVLTAIYGDIGSFTDHTYDYEGFAPRTFNSFRAIGEDAGNSRFYGGIHYQPSINAGLEQGRKVAANILGKLGVYSSIEK